MASAAGRISAPVEREAETGSIIRAPRLSWRSPPRRSTAAFVAGKTHLSATVVVRRLEDLALRGFGGDSAACSKSSPSSAAMAPCRPEPHFAWSERRRRAARFIGNSECRPTEERGIFYEVAVVQLFYPRKEWPEDEPR